MANFQPRNAVIFNHLPSAILSAGVCYTPHHGGNPEVGHYDNITLRLGKENRVGYLILDFFERREITETNGILTIKMICPLRIRLLTRDVED